MERTLFSSYALSTTKREKRTTRGLGLDEGDWWLRTDGHLTGGPSDLEVLNGELTRLEPEFKRGGTRLETDLGDTGTFKT